MKRQKTPDNDLSLARIDRPLARGVGSVYHGTRYLSKAQKAYTLEPEKLGDYVVCFSRSSEEGSYWPKIGWHDPGESGAVLDCGRDPLMQNYRLYPIEVGYGAVVSMRKVSGRTPSFSRADLLVSSKSALYLSISVSPLQS